MEAQKKRIAPVTTEQKKKLTEFLQQHENLRYGKFTSEFSKKKAQELWEEISVILNAIPGGSKKTWTQWRKTWQDMKKNVKAKAVEEKRYATGTGGGPIKIIKYDDTETKILDIISPMATFGDSSVPVPNVEFQFELNNISDIAKYEEEPIPAPVISEENEITEIQTPIIEIAESPKPNRTPGKSTPKPQFKKRSIKARRLEKSIVISDTLVKIEEEKKNVAIQYYKAKIDYMKWRRIYEQEKLKALKNKNSLQFRIVQELKNLNSSLSFH